MSYHSWNLKMAIGLIACMILPPVDLQAGPLCDWLFGRKRQQPAYPVGGPVPVGNGGYAASYGTYYGPRMPVVGPAGAAYTPATPTGVTAAAQPPTMSYVPNYRSSAYRAPVTYYRPVLTTDPSTGAQVVRMAPCTSYEMQTQRVPALGRSALFGSGQLPPVVPPPRSLPTYTLPTWGVPLASASPTTLAPNAAQNPGYATMMPSNADGRSIGNYPTVPLGSSRYYGSSTGGCIGSYAAPGVAPPTTPPGLVAPQQAAPTIRTPAPTYGQPTTPPDGVYPQSSPSAPGSSVLPGSGMGPGAAPPPLMPAPTSPANGSPSSPTIDPADRPPTLPGNFPTGNRIESQEGSRMRKIVRQPQTAPSTSVDADSPDEDRVPLLTPIPVPEDFDRHQRWNPGLMTERDLTAQKADYQKADYSGLEQYAGQAKLIQWASFEEPRRAATGNSEVRRYQAPATNLKPATETDQPRPPSERASVAQPSRPPARERYDTSGWEAVK